MTRPRSIAAWMSSMTMLVLLTLTGCGGGGGGEATAGTTAVTLTWPSGRVMAVGGYAPGTTTRTGEWREYFDEPGSPQQWRRSYTEGTWDPGKDWREWNRDGSIRNDAGDH